MSDLHQQDKQDDSTKPSSELGTLVMQLEKGHWGLETQHPDSLPSTWQPGTEAVVSREEDTPQP